LLWSVRVSNTPYFSELERLLAMWFKQVTSSSAVISATLPREMALDSAQMLNIEYLQAYNVCVVFD